MHDLTRADWIEAYAARWIERTGVDRMAALKAAEAAWTRLALRAYPPPQYIDPTAEADGDADE